MAIVNVNVFCEKNIGGTALYSVTSETQNETLSTSNVSQASTIVTDGNTRLVRIAADANVWVAFGASPTAVTGQGHLILGGTPEIFFCRPGIRIAVVD